MSRVLRRPAVSASARTAGTIAAWPASALTKAAHWAETLSFRPKILASGGVSSVKTVSSAIAAAIIARATSHAFWLGVSGPAAKSATASLSMRRSRDDGRDERIGVGRIGEPSDRLTQRRCPTGEDRLDQRLGFRKEFFIGQRTLEA